MRMVGGAKSEEETNVEQEEKILPQLSDGEVDIIYDKLIKLDFKHDMFKGSKREYILEFVNRIDSFLLNSHLEKLSGSGQDEIDEMIGDTELKKDLTDGIKSIMREKLKQELVDEKRKDPNVVLDADERKYLNRSYSISNINRIKENLKKEHPDLKDDTIDTLIEHYKPDIKTKERKPEVIKQLKTGPKKIPNIAKTVPLLNEQTFSELLHKVEKFENVAEGLNVIRDTLRSAQNPQYEPSSRAIFLGKFNYAGNCGGNINDKGTLENLEEMKNGESDRNDFVTKFKDSYPSKNVKDLKPYDDKAKVGLFSEYFFNKVFLDKFVKDKAPNLYNNIKKKIDDDKNPIKLTIKQLVGDWDAIDNDYDDFGIEQKYLGEPNRSYGQFKKIIDMGTKKHQYFIFHSSNSTKNYIKRATSNFEKDDITYKANIAPDVTKSFDINKFKEVMVKEDTEYYNKKTGKTITFKDIFKKDKNLGIYKVRDGGKDKFGELLSGQYISRQSNQSFPVEWGITKPTNMTDIHKVPFIINLENKKLIEKGILEDINVFKPEKV